MTPEEIVKSPALLELLEQSLNSTDRSLRAAARMSDGEAVLSKRRKRAELKKVLEAVKRLQKEEASQEAARPRVDFSGYWTKPYYGVTHLGRPGRNNHWCTVIHYGEYGGKFAELKLWSPSSGFDPARRVMHEGTLEKSVAKAKRLGEDWLRDKTYQLA